MDWTKVADKAQEVIDKRGGMQSVGEDAEELREIAERQGTLSEKLKAAAAAVKEPGAHHEPGTDPESGLHPKPGTVPSSEEGRLP